LKMSTSQSMRTLSEFKIILKAHLHTDFYDNISWYHRRKENRVNK